MCIFPLFSKCCYIPLDMLICNPQMPVCGYKLTLILLAVDDIVKLSMFVCLLPYLYSAIFRECCCQTPDMPV